MNKYSSHDQSQENLIVTAEKIGQESPWWKSSLTLLCTLGGASLIGFPLIIDGFTHRVNSVFLVDVSLSNQPYASSVQKLCHQYIERLVDGDVRIVGKFADKPTILNNQEFQERDRLSIQKQCQQITTQPLGVGQAPGTSLVDALSLLETELQHQSNQGKTQPVAAVVVIQAAEGVNHQKQDFTLIKSKIESITKTGGAVAIVGSAIDLQSQLISQLVSVKNTQICTYADSQACLDWLFLTARK